MKTGLNTKEDLPMEKQVGLTGQEVEERIRSGQVKQDGKSYGENE